MPSRPTNDKSVPPLSRAARWAVLAAAFTGLLFDGIELGLMPVASLSVSRALLGGEFTHTLAGDWFARFTASLMLGAAIGGIVLGNLGDRIGRTRAMGISVLFYSVFAGLGAFVQTQEQMLVLRFLVGLGVGGMWPNGVVLVSECWPNASRPMVAGVMGAGINAGILVLSQLARNWPITPDSWRWIFQLAAIPAMLGVLVIFALPESPKWLARRSSRHSQCPGCFRKWPQLYPGRAVSTAVATSDADRHRARLDPACRRLGRQQVDDSLGGQAGQRHAARLQGNRPGLVGAGSHARQFPRCPGRCLARAPALVLPDQFRHARR